MTTAAADRENRALEAATESILVRLADLKTSLSKLTFEPKYVSNINFPSYIGTVTVNVNRGHS